MNSLNHKLHQCIISIKHLIFSKNTLVKLMLMLIANFILITSLNATTDRTITITNNCDFDIYWANVSNPIVHNGELITCDVGMTSCYEGKGICGDDSLCYYKAPKLKFGNDGQDDNFLRSKSTKIYDVNLIPIDNFDQYSLSIAAQLGCRRDPVTNVFKCSSADCKRNNNTQTGSQCSTTSELEGPYTLANIIYRNSANDEYNISLEKGINIPLSISPIADYIGEQNFQKDFFCKKVGVDNCNWRFDTESISNKIQPHIFTQIDRDVTSDITSLCQTTSDCNDDLICGLKYPEDLFNYSGTGYCGKALGYYNPITLCSNDNVSNGIKKLFNCSYNTSSPDNSENTYNIDTPVEDRCPESFIEVSLKGIDNSAKRFCIADLFSCNTKSHIINNISYTYFDSCYNHSYTSPNSGACCGCVDWPGITTDERVICMRPEQTQAPNPCSIDFAVNAPDCKPNFDTKASKANAHWSRFVQPYLKWIVDGCNQAKEYTYGDKHSTQYCSSQNTPDRPGNNINYLVTVCPNGYDLFTNQKPSQSTNVLKQYISNDNKIIKSRFAGEVNNTTILIIATFLFMAFLLIIYFIAKRDKE